MHGGLHAGDLVFAGRCRGALCGMGVKSAQHPRISATPVRSTRIIELSDTASS